MALDVLQFNRAAWDKMVEGESQWTLPVGAAEIEAAREGRWQIVLTPVRPVPRSWFPALAGADVLCLASGGGQQGPILAAAGAQVVILDASPKQLDRDRSVAAEHQLELVAMAGDMADLSGLDDDSFDLVFHPASNMFVPDVMPVWRECYRVLRRGGVLLAGFANPVIYMVEPAPALGNGALAIVHQVPYSDAESLSAGQQQEHAEQGTPLEFGHTLEQLIGGQLDAGFVLTGFYEDAPSADDYPLARFTKTFIATRAVK
jgi:SAM-dependent methyltransferase